jgi:prolyl 4-hydroxylase
MYMYNMLIMANKEIFPIHLHLIVATWHLDFIAHLSHYKPSFPSEGDLSGAATALRRLQNTYRLAAGEIVDGKIPGDQQEMMSASDCYHLGRVAYEDKDYKHTRDWMSEAVKRWKFNDISNLNLVDVYDYLAFSEYKV